jgi:hypothetical protein
VCAARRVWEILYTSVPVGRPVNVPDQTGIPYVPVGRPVNVPDQTGIPYVPVGRVLTRHSRVGINSDLHGCREHRTRLELRSVRPTWM